MCKSVFRKVRNVFQDPITSSLASKSSGFAAVVDPMDIFGYQEDINAQKAAQQKAEYEAKQAQIKSAEDLRLYEEELRRNNAISRINALFGVGDGVIKGGTADMRATIVKPEQLDVQGNLAAQNEAYEKVRQNNLGLMLDELSRNRESASRDLRFGLARSGLAGGSVDISENKNIADTNQLGIIQANQLADSQVASMKSQDESTRANLINRINAGLDADSAADAASRQMSLTREQAMAEPKSSAMNNLFQSIGNFWNSYQYSSGASNPYATVQKAVGSGSGTKGRLTY